MTLIDSPLRLFRTARDLSLDQVAERFGVNKTTVMRVETGESPADADMVEKIIAFTGGTVGAAEMHAIRLAWLKANRPDRFREASK